MVPIAATSRPVSIRRATAKGNSPTARGISNLVTHIPPARVEGTVSLPDGRHLGFAEFGDPNGPAVLWFHGTPGAGDSTPHFHDRVLDWTGDVATVLDHLGADRYAAIGLSGGGPYVLACGHTARSNGCRRRAGRGRTDNGQ